MIGLEPTYGPNGTFGYGGFARTGGRNVGPLELLEKYARNIKTSDPRSPNFIMPRAW
jgi:hypothetical protein